MCCLLGCSSNGEIALGTDGTPTASAGGIGSGGGSAEALAGSSGASSAVGGDAPPPGELISVQDGMFRPEGVPTQAAENGGALPAIARLTGPAAVTNGGTATLLVQLATPVAEPIFLVSLANQPGYHTVPGTDADGDGTYAIRVQVSAAADQPSLVLRVALTDGVGSVGEWKDLEIALVQSGQGDVKITLSFDRLHDLDLHVIEPSGEEISHENGSSATGGMLDLDDGANCQPGSAFGENIFWPPGGAPKGQYRVTVHNYQQCTPGAIDFTVRVAYDGTVMTHGGSFADGTVGSVFDVTTFSR